MKKQAIIEVVVCSVLFAASFLVTRALLGNEPPPTFTVENNVTVEVDTGLQNVAEMYKQEFIELLVSVGLDREAYRANFVPVTVTNDLGSTSGNAVGVCYGYVDKESKRVRAPLFIRFSKEAFIKYPDMGRRWVIWHELGHCVLGMGHGKGEGVLMRPSVPPLQVMFLLTEELMYKHFLEMVSLYKKREGIK